MIVKMFSGFLFSEARFSKSVGRSLAVTALVIFLASGAFAATEKILHAFGAGADGTQPYAGLVFDASGNLYGTVYSGSTGNGAVYKLAPGAGGVWTETLIYSFKGGTDGANPTAALIVDASGNLYGTTSRGGASGQGTAFKLTHGSAGAWTEKILHSFSFGSPAGDMPLGALALDSAGNLFGTTSSGGTNEVGAVFKLTPSTGGNYTSAAIHAFNDNGHDGANPAAGVIIDTAGNLYGTTQSGGAFHYGIVYKLSKNASGGYVETFLHTFNPANGHDGAEPVGSVVMDASGNLYGTTSTGGANRFYGIVYKLTLGTNGKYTESYLHTFSDGNDGGEPQANVILDAAGNVYGTANTGGTAGVAFKLTHQTNGTWTLADLHNFHNGADGAHPRSGLIFDAAGALYGTTQLGGANSMGTVFKITP